MGFEMFGSFHDHQAHLVDGRNGICFGFLRGSFFPRLTKQTKVMIGLLVLIIFLSAKVSMGDVEIFNSEEQCAISLAKYIADLSSEFVKKKGIFTVVLSGDSLIITMRKLLEDPYVNSVEWSKWYVFWVDERVVPKSSPQSNYKLDYEKFLSKVPIPSEHIISINDKLISSPESTAVDYETQLRQLASNKVIPITPTGFPSFDVMLLGLGLNGHIASLFPNRPQLKENKKWVTFIKDSPKPPPTRITMTFPVIDSSSNVAFVVTDSNQASIVKAVLDGKKNNQSSELLPAQMVSLNGGGEIKWFLDSQAASMLEQN